MPRSGRGGRREGTPGAKYPNRSDLRGPKPAALPVMSPPSTGYGTTSALERQQQALPVAAPAAPAPAPVARAAPAGPVALPGSGGAFDRPTEYEDEPVTAGLPSGPGAGPEVLGLGNPDELDLRAIYLATGSEAIRELVEALEDGL